MSWAVDILIIDDNPGDRLLLDVFFARIPEWQICVRESATLTRGCEVLAQEGADIVFLDMCLPDAEGLACLHTVRSVAPSVPVVVVTGMEDRQLQRTCLAAGASHYLSKMDMSADVLQKILDDVFRETAATGVAVTPAVSTGSRTRRRR